ncbi:ATP-grasp ribosomal peptide maturase [Actinocorallia sp. API 0066]|uniref:ATP-grasp ribosomal peptide maturase n=1 Tax=Actinocorallia sp. API 0066 TaxID=2896846 RepID=UPI001E5BCC8C|nr:ATP-grasp ribosomal peptide maturase [Actinocorallia sp. API 0066]MCD0452834.1 ATP-grasp ribosomal peptide maturase [Actinocorallia sp. API 0066]
MAVLVIADQGDWPTDRVVKTLTDRGVEVFRLDTAEFPTALTVGARLDQAPTWTGTLTNGHRSLQWEDVTAVYYRTPRAFVWPEAMTEPERRFAAAQARYGLGGLITSLDCHWVSHPAAMSAAEYKPRQLTVAARSGLRVPPTLLTTRPDEVRQFAREHGPVVAKPVASPMLWEGDDLKVTYTKLIQPSDLADLTGIDSTVHLFQQWVLKRHEVRLTVVGRRLFAAEIHAHSDAAYIDWRSDYPSLSYTTATVPDPVAQGVRRYMDTMELTYGAFDFIVDLHDRWWFLECNPCGQWDWIAAATGQPIADAIADELQGATR